MKLWMETSYMVWSKLTLVTSWSSPSRSTDAVSSDGMTVGLIFAAASRCTVLTVSSRRTFCCTHSSQHIDNPSMFSFQINNFTIHHSLGILKCIAFRVEDAWLHSPAFGTMIHFRLVVLLPMVWLHVDREGMMYTYCGSSSQFTECSWLMIPMKWSAQNWIHSSDLKLKLKFPFFL